jgi:hypothetical protein
MFIINYSIVEGPSVSIQLALSIYIPSFENRNRIVAGLQLDVLMLERAMVDCIKCIIFES